MRRRRPHTAFEMDESASPPRRSDRVSNHPRRVGIHTLTAIPREKKTSPSGTSQLGTLDRLNAVRGLVCLRPQGEQIMSITGPRLPSASYRGGWSWHCAGGSAPYDWDCMHLLPSDLIANQQHAEGSRRARTISISWGRPECTRRPQDWRKDANDFERLKVALGNPAADSISRLLCIGPDSRWFHEGVSLHEGCDEFRS